MAEYTGAISYIAIDGLRAKIALVANSQTNAPGPELTIYVDAPNTHTIPQLEMARRSWILSLLQNAYSAGKHLVITTDDQSVVTEVHVIVEHIFTGGPIKQKQPGGTPGDQPVKPGIKVTAA